MSRRKIVIFIFVSLLILISTLGLIEFLSYKTVSLKFLQKNISIVIYDKNLYEVAKVDDSLDIKLKKGDYRYKTTSDDFSDDMIDFTVDSNNNVVNINPPFSKNKLRSMFNNEKQDIYSLITSKYPIISSNYTIQEDELFLHGEWYGGRIVQNTKGNDMPDIYRIIMQKIDGKWNIKAGPELIINSSSHSDIPEDIITTVNKPLNN